MAGAVTGSELYARIRELTGAAREAEILAASVSPWILEWIPITIVSYASGAEGAPVKHTLTYRVGQDGWSVGPSSNFLRTPLSYRSARGLALANGWTFPTSKMVAQIHAAADVRLIMPTFGPPREASSTYLAAHDAIEKQRGGASGLQSGAKKDLVISPLLAVPTSKGAPGKQIFGGAQSATAAPKWWQGLSKPPAHDVDYVDYSEQYRPVHRKATLDGASIDLHELLRSPELAPLVSSEGAYDADAMLAIPLGGTLTPTIGAAGVKGAPFAPAATPTGRAVRAVGAFGVAGFLVWLARQARRWWDL